MLETRGLSKVFESTTALRATSLSIEPKEFFSILGPSGCGKTTLLRLLAGFEKPSTGDIFYQGQCLTSLPPERRPFNLIFQRYALFPHLSVKDNIAFGPRMDRLSEREVAARVDEMLALVQMTDLADRNVQTLSGGQQQRVAIARALAKRPKILLLDEPLSALDHKLRQQMQVELRALQQKLGLTFVFVTHDQDEAMALSDRIVVMNNGVAEQIGSPRQIYEQPQTAFVAQFIGSINRLSETKMIRPERILLWPQGVPQMGAEQGTILQISYQGANTQVVFEAEKSGTLRVSYPNTAQRYEFKEGMRAQVSWKAEDILCVPE